MAKIEGLFHGKTVVITGAAHGIGRATAIAFGGQGAKLLLLDIREGPLTETAQLAKGQGAFVQSQVADVTRPGDLQRALEALSGDGPHVLVNVAGGVVGQTHRPIEEVTDEEWEAVVRANLYGTFHAIRAVAPVMKRQRYGRIVNISSGAGRTVSLTGIQAYASSKAGQLGLTRQMAHELGPYGIMVNAIAPGFVRSNPDTERQWQSYSRERQRQIIEGLPLRRLGEPEDIASGVLFLASDHASWITGQCLSIDGGSIMM